MVQARRSGSEAADQTRSYAEFDIRGGQNKPTMSEFRSESGRNMFARFWYAMLLRDRGNSKNFAVSALALGQARLVGCV